MKFEEFGKIPRLNRTITITEKIDGTNGLVHVEPIVKLGDTTLYPTGFQEAMSVAKTDEYWIFAGSRTRWVTPGKQDNHGFAGWVRDNATELVKLGPGRHFGEWWGGSIQRGYGVKDKRFSLFNLDRWADATIRPTCCLVVPPLYEGPFDKLAIDRVLDCLRQHGSTAVKGYDKPEGIVIYHHAANRLFKVTLEDDEVPKEVAKKERPPKVPRDQNKGGRRKEQLPYEGEDRRKR